MTFQISQKGHIITLASFDDQYCAFNGITPDPEEYQRWFPFLEVVFNTWGNIADYSDTMQHGFCRQLGMQDGRTLTARDASKALGIWASVTSFSFDDALRTLEFLRPICKFFDSLEDTKFYFSI